MSDTAGWKHGNAAAVPPHGTRILGLICLVLPWVNPFAPGPSAAMVPWLVSAFCAVIAWAVVLRDENRAGAWRGYVAPSWLAAATLSTAVALIQYFGLSQDLAPWVSTSAVGEAFGNLRQRNQFATLTGIGVAALLCWTPPMRRRHSFLLMALMATGNAASASRTGLLQLAMLSVFMALWRSPDRKRRLELCLVGGLAYLAAAMLLPALLEAFTGTVADTIWRRFTRGDGCSSRAILWSNVMTLIAQKPLLGWGLGELDYAHYITLYPGARFCDILDNAHNLPLHLAVELGIPVALALCLGFAWAVARARPWRETDPTRQMAWSVVAVILLHSMLEYPLWYGPFQIAFVLCLGLIWPALAQRMLAPARCGNAVLQTLAVVLLAAIVFAAWDYRRISQIYLPYDARDPAYQEDTIAKIRTTPLFGRQVDFAELTITPLTRENAQWSFDTGLELLHFSPEPRVIEKVIESATMLGRDDVARAHLARYRAAFPADHARWSAAFACTLPASGTRSDCPPIKD